MTNELGTLRLRVDLAARFLGRVPMLDRHSFCPYPETRFASSDGKRAVSAQHSPRQNYLLAALPLEEYERLLADLEPVALPLGWTVHGAGNREKHLYFLTSGIIAKLYVKKNGASTGFAVAGSEGVIGVASFLGGESTPSQAVVLSTGYAYRLQADLLKDAFDHDHPLPHLLLHYTQALIEQIGQVAVCNRHHSVEQQLCRWILSCLDRLPSNELTMTQGLIADMLGVRREGVSVAAGKLQEAGLIHYRRGDIVVLDRPRLEAQVCECYAVIKREYDRLLRPEDAIVNTGVHGTRSQYRTGCRGPRLL
ncbi:MAG TPA: Crp/Fnr family transcriptional regulator [Acidiferrobacterales bacterium]|nr:Crp/Fnr family transcriptional regulator [Acidiferrobacterales bacterium]